MACFPDRLGNELKSAYDTLKVQCSCGHKKEWKRLEALLLFGEHADPMAIRRKLVCKECGKKPGKVWI